MQKVSKLALIGFIAVTGEFAELKGGDWPQFLGPNRNGVASNEASIQDWKTNSSTKLWTLKVGSGFSSPIGKGSKIYLYHRENNHSVLDCLDLKTGDPLWKYQHPTQYRDDFGFDPGPRATPCLDDDAIFLMSADGILTSVNALTGQRIWEIDAREKWNTDKGFFGRAPSPVVFDDVVIFIIGGKPKAGIIALDRSTGNLKWKATSDPAGYASPVIENSDASPTLWAWTRENIHALNPKNGALMHSRPLRSRMNASVNAATPLILPEGLFLSAGYGVGATLFKVTDNTMNPVWTGDEMSNHYATCVYHDGFLYGFHGRQEFGPEFRCIEASSGKVRWSKKGLGAGSVIRVNHQLFMMLESGELIIAQTDAEQFQVLARKQILPSGVRAFPAYINGHFVARSPEQMVCFKFGL